MTCGCASSSFNPRERSGKLPIISRWRPLKSRYGVGAAGFQSGRLICSALRFVRKYRLPGDDAASFWKSRVRWNRRMTFQPCQRKAAITRYRSAQGVSQIEHVPRGNQFTICHRRIRLLPLPFTDYMAWSSLQKRRWIARQFATHRASYLSAAAGHCDSASATPANRYSQKPAAYRQL